MTKSIIRQLWRSIFSGCGLANGVHRCSVNRGRNCIENDAVKNETAFVQTLPESKVSPASSWVACSDDGTLWLVPVRDTMHEGRWNWWIICWSLREQFAKYITLIFPICIAVRSSSGWVRDAIGQISYNRVEKLSKIPASHMILFPFLEPSGCGSQTLWERHTSSILGGPQVQRRNKKVTAKQISTRGTTK